MLRNNEAKNDVVAGTATNDPSNAAGVLDTVSQTVAPGAGQGLDTATTAVEKTNSMTTASTNVTSDGNKVEPGQAFGRHRKPPTGWRVYKLNGVTPEKIRRAL